MRVMLCAVTGRNIGVNIELSIASILNGEFQFVALACDRWNGLFDGMLVRSRYCETMRPRRFRRGNPCREFSASFGIGPHPAVIQGTGREVVELDFIFRDSPASTVSASTVCDSPFRSEYRYSTQALPMITKSTTGRRMKLCFGVIQPVTDSGRLCSIRSK